MGGDTLLNQPPRFGYKTNYFHVLSVLLNRRYNKKKTL